ncbi:MAG: DISARM system phospholipase D-like protein DrmC [Terracidiphilus sp.]|jgi:phosphatidylserine/phosphatidylglycerophosphate/cardiolipin synthase-like enzyme
MRESLFQLSPNELRALASAFRTGRISSPCSAPALSRYVSEPIVDQVAAAIEEMTKIGYSSAGISYALDLVADCQVNTSKLDDAVQLVMSGPQLAGSERRDTGVVVSDLFRNAQENVLIAGYAIYQGRRLFSELANRMDELPKLDVRMFLDISRKPGDTSTSDEIVRRFADRFRSEEWPQSSRVPKVFYDSRGLELDWTERASMHAKCVVVDGHRVFVSSANFTEAAQERNVEIGVLFESIAAAARINRFFAALADSGQFRRVL